MKATIISNDLKRLIKSTKKFVADGENNKLMQYIKIEVRECTITAIALDGHRITKETLECSSDCDFSCFIKPILPVLKNIEVCTIELIGDYAYITAGENRVGFKQPEGEYYDTDKYFKKEAYETFAICFDTKLLKEALDSLPCDKAILRFSNRKAPVYIHTAGKEIISERVVLPVNSCYIDN